MGLRRCGGVVNESIEELDISDDTGRESDSEVEDSCCRAVRLYRLAPVAGRGTTTGSVDCGTSAPLPLAPAGVYSP